MTRRRITGASIKAPSSKSSPGPTPRRPSPASTAPTGPNPYAAPRLDAQGNIYGTTDRGGVNNQGTVYKIDANSGALSTLVSFNGANGAYPIGALTVDARGNIFGTTLDGGANNLGTVFEIAAGTTSLSTLISFNGSNGASPYGAPTLDAKGNLYGTTFGVGFDDQGTAFEIAAGTGAFSTLVSFHGTNLANPFGTITLDALGNLYGTTGNGGANQYGAIFELVNNAAVVPEPASLVIVGQATLVGLGLMIRARSRHGR